MFRIGEFSKIAQTPVSQLRYYDQIGLFQPAHTDKFTSYRYYSAQQLPDLNRIIALKELGLSLAQIRRMIDDNVSEDEIRGMLALKKAQIEQNIHEEIARLRTVESRLRHITDDGEMKDFDVVVKSIPAQPYMSWRETLANVYEGLNICHEMYRLLPAHVKEKYLGQFTSVLHD